MCSTPCGINGKTTIGGSSGDQESPECSTPCGINGKTTRLSTVTKFERRLSAQRLAASTEKPPSPRKKAGQWPGCAQRLAASTEKPPSPRSCVTPATKCAQRLAASTEKPHKKKVCLNSRLFRAQRLAASTEKPHSHQLRAVRIGRVLNALRHQRKNHSG